MDSRFPVGPFEPSSDHSPAARSIRIETIVALPDLLEEAVHGLGDRQLDTPYREGGWTLRQVVHHLADSHANAAIRFRLAFTEDHPTIKPYDQDAWARLTDASSAPVGPSLDLIRGLHHRWAGLLRSVPEAAFSRTVHHPEIGSITVDWLLDQYAWHGRHHLGHITDTRRRHGW